MPYTVTWDPAARDELARIWLAALDRKAVADAADTIDRLLRSSPENVGEELGPYRWHDEEPLTVIFAISPDDCKVEVLQVWRN